MIINERKIAQLDAQDSLAKWRSHFQLPDELVYLNGNSLGPLSVEVVRRNEMALLQEWGAQQVRAWNTAGWFNLASRAGDKLGSLMGARAGETVIADSTSVNLFKLAHGLLDQADGRRVVLVEKASFPTDNYIVQGLLKSRPELELREINRQEWPEALHADVALAVVNHVHYRDGHRLDMARLQAIATAHEVPLIWDLAHSVGAVLLDLHRCGVQYAVGCGYKFLNGGPGAPGFVFLAKEQQGQIESPLCGWFGHAKPFEFDDQFVPAADIRRWQVGTPPILSLSALDAALDVFQQVEMDQLWAKSKALYECFRLCMAATPELEDWECVTPESSADRGSQVSFFHPQAQAVCRALAKRGVIADYRHPHLLRFGLAPLYNRFSDVYRAVAALNIIVKDGLWRDELGDEMQAEVT